MSWWLGALLAALAAYLALVGVLLAAGRRSDARALAGFIPDCVVLVRRLIGDPRVSRPRKLLLSALVLYLALPVDLVPDVIPVAGQLDDAILLGLALRAVVRGAGVTVVEEHWPGPARSVAVVLALAGARAPRT